MASSILSRDRSAFPSPADLDQPDCAEVHSDELLDDEQLRAEMSRLMAANRELVSGNNAEHFPTNASGEVEKLRAENAELRACLEEMENAWQERQREFDSLLDEKTEVIRGLHLKLKDVSEPAPVRHADPADINEVARLKRELEEQRRQLMEDEEALKEQMREMELAMSRERAEMARQRSQVNRLQAEIHHEAETSARDSGLRERLSSLRRSQSAPAVSSVSQGASVSQPTPLPSKNTTGFFRRMFGSNS
ncbi:MAG: hypothetical protein FJ271_04620 [Planctomycetes bacterium]|nr:hypothetical protein [Planctomycetota bacterium]